MTVECSQAGLLVNAFDFPRIQSPPYATTRILNSSFDRNPFTLKTIVYVRKNVRTRGRVVIRVFVRLELHEAVPGREDVIGRDDCAAEFVSTLKSSSSDEEVLPTKCITEIAHG